MSRYDESWCEALAERASGASADGVSMRLLFVVTDTEEGKVAFNLDLENGAPARVAAGKLPRGEKADVTVTVKEHVLLDLWSGSRTRDEAFMAGDVKIEGAYERWLDQLVPLFAAGPWADAFASG